jgi:hypothetical protein
MLVGSSSMPKTVMPETSHPNAGLDDLNGYKVHDIARISKEQRLGQQLIQQGICHRNDVSRGCRDAWRIAQV